jgi:hypothetical protein
MAKGKIVKRRPLGGGSPKTDKKGNPKPLRPKPKSK